MFKEAAVEQGLMASLLVSDMINILKLPYVPRTCCWVHGIGEGMTLLAVYVTILGKRAGWF